MIDFTNRVAIVAGAGTGLGRAHALGLAARGAETVVAEASAAGADRFAHPADVTDAFAQTKRFPRNAARIKGLPLDWTS